MGHQDCSILNKLIYAWTRLWRWKHVPISADQVWLLAFFPQPLVDGFSKLWLRGKGNLGLETLIPAGSMPGFMLGPVLAFRKQHFLPGFLQKTCKNNNCYKVFCKTHAKIAVFIRSSWILKSEIWNVKSEIWNLK